MSSVINISNFGDFGRDYPVAACPDCGTTKWYILIDQYNSDWKKILGTECACCGLRIDWTAKLSEVIDEHNKEVIDEHNKK